MVVCIRPADCFTDAIIVACFFVVFESYAGCIFMDFVVDTVSIILCGII